MLPPAPFFPKGEAMNGIFDSHAHYDDERFDADRDALLERIHREGVELSLIHI